MFRDKNDKELDLFYQSSLQCDPLEIPFFQQKSQEYESLYQNSSSVSDPLPVQEKQVQKQKFNTLQSLQNEVKLNPLSLNSLNEQPSKEQTYRNNPRRKLQERKILQALIYLAKKFSSKDHKENKKISYSEVTKNILAFAKKPHLDFIKSTLGPDFIEKSSFLKTINDKKSINLKDYENMYQSDVLQNVLNQFFSQKILYRFLMTSKITASDRIYYIYFLDVFEKNFRQKRFKSLSQPKVQIELNKIKLRKKENAKKKEIFHE